MNIDFTKYFPIFIAVLVLLIAILANVYMPGSSVTAEVDTVAQEVIKEEVGITVPLPAATLPKST